MVAYSFKIGPASDLSCSQQAKIKTVQLYSHILIIFHQHTHTLKYFLTTIKIDIATLHNI